MGLVKKISERPSCAPVATVVLRELSLFTGRGDRLFVITGLQFYLVPHLGMCKKILAPPLLMQKNSGPPCVGTPRYINNETTQTTMCVLYDD